MTFDQIGELTAGIMMLIAGGSMFALGVGLILEAIQ